MKKKKSVRKGEPLGEEISNETQEKVRGGTQKHWEIISFDHGLKAPTDSGGSSSGTIKVPR